MPYQMIPAGAVPQNRVAIYVTMKDRVSHTNRVELHKTSSRSVTRFECPDRTLHITTSDGGRPDKELNCPIRSDSFDYAVFLDPYSRISAHRRYVKKILVSALSAVKAEFFARDYIPSDVRVLADSGGAQMKLGTYQYVNPYVVINWMNEMADEGACLDIAPRMADYYDKDMFYRAAKVQDTNNKIFLRRRRRSLDLMNVVHGFDLQQIRDWMEVVWDDQFDGMAAGCDNFTTAATAMRNILVPALEAPNNDLRRRLHLFGVSGGATLPASVWLGKLLDQQHEKVEFTTDSASWLYGCTQGMYATFKQDATLEWNNLVKSPSDFAWGTQLPCSCEVCSAVRWTEVFRGGQYGPALAMSYHNLFTLKSYEGYWSKLAQSAKNVKEFLDNAASLGFKKIPEVIGAIKYVDFAAKNGLDEAERKFAPILGAFSAGGTASAKAMEAMFATDSSEEEEVEKKNSKLAGETMVPGQVRNADSIEPILENFESAGFEKFLSFEHHAPNREAVYTGYQIMEKAIGTQRKKKKEDKTD